MLSCWEAFVCCLLVGWLLGCLHSVRAGELNLSRASLSRKILRKRAPNSMFVLLV